MIESKKFIFISHHHEDQSRLAILKEKLEKTQFSCFLAHQDIQEGEDYTKAIEESLRKCDVFLYVGSEKAHKSNFCQQELGMAIGLNKLIMLMMQKSASPPDGFARHLQALIYEDIDEAIIDIMHSRLSEKILENEVPDRQVSDALNIAGIKRFSTIQTNNDDDIICLTKDNWNDEGYLSKFAVTSRGEKIAQVKIITKEQRPLEHIAECLPRYFYKLPERFISRIWFEDNIDANKREMLSFLLNDFDSKSEHEQSQLHESEHLVEKVLYRWR